MADLTPEKEQEFKFRLRLEQEQAQEQAASAEAGSSGDYINPLIPTILGAAAGPIVGPGITKGAEAFQETKDLIKQGWDPKVASNYVRDKYQAVEKWTRQMLKGEYYGGRDFPEAWQKGMETRYPQGAPQAPRAAPAAPMTPPPTGMKAGPSGLLVPQSFETATKEAAAAGAPSRTAARAASSPTLQAMRSALGVGLPKAVPAVLGRGLAGGMLGYQGADIYNRLNENDFLGGTISGLGAVGSLASFAPHPVVRYGGMGVSIGAEMLNRYLDQLKQGDKKMAEGGKVKKTISKAERAANHLKKLKMANGGPVMNPMPPIASPSISAQLADQAPPQQGLPPVHTIDLMNMPDSSTSRPLIDGQNPNMRYTPGFNEGGKLPPPENAARTQIIGTLPTYEKAAEELKKRGAQGRAIDFGAGLGEGAKILKADTYEPFPKGWKPTFIDPKQIPTEAYGKLTNLNVMNVVPPKVRDEIASHIGRVIEPGGQGIVTTRGADVMKAKGRPGPEPMSIITSRDTYQKGFTKQELEDYMKRMLGEKYDVNKLNLGPAGVHVQKKKPTIYTGGGISIPVNAPVGSRAQETTGQGAAQIMNPLNLNFKEGGHTTPAWQRAEGKSPSGGLNALGRASYKRETGGELKAPQPEGGSRKKSFCARMGGMKKKLTSSKTANDPDSRINKALRKWKC